ncbi:MAG TPA: ferritin-like domain-containing protein [Planctomycetota bacterium]|nr:ferritin-like domain-containing protein [Planctomycetota bacterium]
MHLFNHEFHDLKDLFLEQLKDIYDCENRLIDALPLMADAATTPELKSAFNDHLAETRSQCERLEKMFRFMKMEPERETCEGIKGLIDEGDEMIGAKGDDMVRDAALIAAAQKIEHYEMASYGTLRTWAEHLGMDECARTLQGILDEEERTDKKLTQIAEARINAMAHH